MIYGVGTDIVAIERMEGALARHGERLARRILMDGELAEFRKKGGGGRFLAKRFAAKEAAAKALGLGFRDGFALRHVGVAHEPGGRPYLVWSGRGREVLAERGIGEGFLSIADERDHAIAFVTLTRKGA